MDTITKGRLGYNLLEKELLKREFEIYIPLLDIVPISVVEQYKSAISVKTLEPYKNNFTQLEPQIGNSLSGHDDIGETLTGNTEGIE